MICVETVSFLPNCQSYGRDLAGQREPSHLGLHAFGQQAHVEILERPAQRLALMAVLLKISFI
jgi:hypothetical protein